MVMLPSQQNAPLPAGGDLIAHLGASPQPAIIHYHHGGDRTELSGRVSVNWAAKTANLFDLHGLGAGDQALVDIRADWSGLALVLGAAWADLELTMAETTLTASSESADVIITTNPHRWADHAAELIAVTDSSEQTPPSDQPLPDHAIDYAQEVPSQADQCTLPVPDLQALPGSLASADAGRRLVEQQPDLAQVHEKGLVYATGPSPRPLSAALFAAALEQWARRQPVILIAEDQLAQHGAAHTRLEHLISVERLGPKIS